MNTTDTRTLSPVILQVKTNKDVPQVIVKPTNAENSHEAFEVSLQKNNQVYSAEFWLEKNGNYEVIFTQGAQTIVKPLHVGTQKFLSFQIEFGIFTSLLCMAALGIFLWYKKKKYN